MLTALATMVAAAVATFGADAVTKRAATVVQPAPAGDRRAVRIEHGSNRRGAMVALPARAALALLAVVAALVTVVVAAAPATAPAAALLGLGLGGAAGNTAERLRHGAVTDFVVVGRWPAFNVADVALVASAVATPLAVLL